MENMDKFSKKVSHHTNMALIIKANCLGQLKEFYERAG